LVIGAGVTGLTTATRLTEAGFSVRIVSALPPSKTTSVAAGASWGPSEGGGDLGLEWSKRTLFELEKLALDPTTGVKMVKGLEASRSACQPPVWVRWLEKVEPCNPGDLPNGYQVGWRYTMPLVDMPTYLKYLEKWLADRGVHIEPREVKSLDSFDADEIVVNCTGWQAHELCSDKTVSPTKGQLVVVKNPGIEEFFQDFADNEEEMVYFFPHGDHVVLGGSAVKADTSLEADLDVARGIVERCSKIAPKLATTEILGHRVGLRPSRREPRVEIEQRRATIVHNYGHGGAGVTLSWGCATKVLDLVLGITHGVQSDESDVQGEANLHRLDVDLENPADTREPIVERGAGHVRAEGGSGLVTARV
jgi:D-amino-acid oxidase